MLDTERARIIGRKALYRGGERLRLVAWAPSAVIDDNATVPPGTEGTVVKPFPVDDGGTISVLWDNGARLGLCLRDEFEVVG